MNMSLKMSLNVKIFGVFKNIFYSGRPAFWWQYYLLLCEQKVQHLDVVRYRFVGSLQAMLVTYSSLLCTVVTTETAV